MKRILVLLLILIFVLAACGGDDDSDDSGDSGDTQDTTAQQSGDESEETEDEEEPQENEEPEEEFSIEVPEGYSDAELLTLPFEDVVTGETFAFASFAGRPILVQGVAVNCAGCIETHNTIRDEIIAELGTEDFVFISFDPSFNRSTTQLEALIEENEYDWIFMQLSQDLRFAMQRLLGPPAVNGSGQPRFYIGPDGTILQLETASGGTTLLEIGAIDDAQAIIDNLSGLATEGSDDAADSGEEEDMAEGDDAEMTEEAPADDEDTEETSDDATDGEDSEEDAEEPEATEEA